MHDEGITELARAKVNLTLHVGAIIKDLSDPFYGYHPLDSLVMFADVADTVTLIPASETSLNIIGPFAKNLTVASDNLILRAIESVRQRVNIPNFFVTLEKNIPVSAGLGGGSANAAAVLRALESYYELPEKIWHDIAIGLGADVPVCRLSQTAHMTGIGENVATVKTEEKLWAVLVNPLQAVSTGAIFKAFDLDAPDATPKPQAKTGGLLSLSLSGSNDLQSTATRQLPLIADILRALASQQGCELARMSGSGASCFGLYQTRAASLKAAENISSLHGDWWVKATKFG